MFFLLFRVNLSQHFSLTFWNVLFPARARPHLTSRNIKSMSILNTTKSNLNIFHRERVSRTIINKVPSLIKYYEMSFFLYFFVIIGKTSCRLTHKHIIDVHFVAIWHFPRLDIFAGRLELCSAFDAMKVDREKNRLYEIYYICNTCFSTVKMP